MENQESSNKERKYTFQSFNTNEYNRETIETINKLLNGTFEYQLLYIYGKSGTGKTHILQAAINYLENQGIQKKLYYVKAMSFQDEFLQSVKKRTLMDFMKKYSELDLLFLDDFQMFSNKQALQEQLEYILVILDLYGKSVVIASEKPIDELSGISERLKKRIKKGAIVHLKFQEIIRRRCILFCGESGSGKTMAVYKYFATFLKEAKYKVQIISMDSYSIKGRYESEKICKLCGIQFHLFEEEYIGSKGIPTVQSIQEIERILSKSTGYSINLFDLSGIRHQFYWIDAFRQACGRLEEFIDLEVFYCIPIFSSTNVIKEELKALSEIPNCTGILTFSDNPFIADNKLNSILQLDESKIIKYKTAEKINKIYTVC